MDEPDRRTTERVVGPFEANREGGFRLALYNLSEGGCFVNASNEPAIGQRDVLRIGLPNAAAVTVTAEVVRAQAGFGYGVKFVDMTEEARLQLRRSLSTLRRFD